MSFTDDVINLLNSKGAKLPADATGEQIWKVFTRLVFPPSDPSMGNTLRKSAAAIPNDQTQTAPDASATNAPYSRLLGCSPSTVTPAKAVIAFQQEISRMVRDDGLSLSDAWSKLKTLEPDVFNRFNNAPLTPGGAAPLDNAGTPQPDIAQRIVAQKPFIAGALHLPANVDNGVLTAAVQANGNQWVKVNPMKIWTALHVLTMQKNHGMSLMDSKAKMTEDYPELSKFAGQMPGQAAGASGQS